MDTIIVKQAIDTLALALTNHSHVWTVMERTLYENAIAICDADSEGYITCDACCLPIADGQKNVGHECDLHEKCANVPA